MAEWLLQEGMLLHSSLSTMLAHNHTRTNQVRTFADNIAVLLGTLSSDIMHACRKFFKQLRVDETEDEAIIFLGKYVMDILHELAKKLTNIQGKMRQEVVQPLTLFAQTQANNHREVLHESQQIIYNIQTNSSLLKELNQNYTVNELSLTKSISEREMLKDLVQSEIDQCNYKWRQIKQQYQELMHKADSINSARCSFTMRAQIGIVKLVNRLVGNAAVQQSLQEYATLAVSNETLSMGIKEEIREKLGRTSLLEDTEGEGASGWDEGEGKQKQIIDKFISFFTSRSSLDEEQQQFQEARGLILQQIKWTQYFMSRLKSCLHTQIRLCKVKFRELATILKYIFAVAVEVKDSQTILYNLLYIASRVKHRHQLLIAQLGRHSEFWVSKQLWLDMFAYLKTIKLKGKTHQSAPGLRHGLRQLFSREMWASRSKVSERELKREKASYQARVYEMLYELNSYMGRLELPQPFIFGFMAQRSLENSLPKQQCRKLLEYHYTYKLISTNRLTSNQLTRKIRHEANYASLKHPNTRLAYCLMKVLPYLEVGYGLLQLLLLNKPISQLLKPRVFGRVLVGERPVNNRLRLQLYRVIAYSPFTRDVYRRMVGEVPADSQHNEIISLDAKRSLGWEEGLRVQLVEVLRSYSYYHPDVGYLQGMNYLCQNVLKITTDSYTCYAIFQHLMNNQYSGLYTLNFHGLKVKIYQFMRLLQRERHQLYEHLHSQKIEGQHFLLSWAITLWGETGGDLCWVLWDGFMAYGWKWWFKTCIWLLRVLQPELLQMNFQELMKCFSDLQSSLLNYSYQQLAVYGIDRNTVKAEIDRIVVQDQILFQIEKEYRLKAELINQYLNNLYPNSK